MVDVHRWVLLFQYYIDLRTKIYMSLVLIMSLGAVIGTFMVLNEAINSANSDNVENKANELIIQTDRIFNNIRSFNQLYVSLFYTETDLSLNPACAFVAPFSVVAHSAFSEFLHKTLFISGIQPISSWIPITHSDEERRLQEECVVESYGLDLSDLRSTFNDFVNPLPYNNGPYAAYAYAAPSSGERGLQLNNLLFESRQSEYNEAISRNESIISHVIPLVDGASAIFFLAPVFYNVSHEAVNKSMDIYSSNVRGIAHTGLNLGEFFEEAISPFVSSYSVSIYDTESGLVLFTNGNGEYSLVREFEIGVSIWEVRIALNGGDLSNDPIILPLLLTVMIILLAIGSILLISYSIIRETESSRETLKSLQIISDYSSMISHDIRTPLSTLELITKDLMTMELTENVMKLCNTQLYSIAIIKMMMDNIKIYEKMITNRMENLRPFYTSFNINETIERLVSIISVYYLKSVHKLEVHIEGEPYVSSDEAWVSQIILNFLTNAIKYTDSGIISISVICGEQISIEVADTGIGVSDYMKPVLFYKGMNNPYKGQDSNGIGLFSVATLCNILNATYGVRDNVVGSMATPSPPRIDKINDYTYKNDESPSSIQSRINTAIAERDVEMVNIVSKKSKGSVFWVKIPNMKLDKVVYHDISMLGMIIDDIEVSCLAISRHLSFHNMETIICTSGKMAIEKYDEFYNHRDTPSYSKTLAKNIDFIITDYHMPHMTGVELIATLRKRPTFSAITICMTGDINHDITGFDAVLIKPVSEKDLLHVLLSVAPSRSANLV